MILGKAQGTERKLNQAEGSIECSTTSTPHIVRAPVFRFSTTASPSRGDDATTWGPLRSLWFCGAHHMGGTFHLMSFVQPWALN